MDLGAICVISSLNVPKWWFKKKQVPRNPPYILNDTSFCSFFPHCAPDNYSELKLLWFTPIPQPLAYGYIYKPVAGSEHRSIEEDPFFLHPGITNVQFARINKEKEKIGKVMLLCNKYVNNFLGELCIISISSQASFSSPNTP